MRPILQTYFFINCILHLIGLHLTLLTPSLERLFNDNGGFCENSRGKEQIGRIIGKNIDR